MLRSNGQAIGQLRLHVEKDNDHMKRRESFALERRRWQGETITAMAHSLLQRAEQRIELEANVPYEQRR